MGLPAYVRYEVPRTTLQGNKLLFRLGGIPESGLHESETKMFAIHELCKISVLQTTSKECTNQFFLIVPEEKLLDPAGFSPKFKLMNLLKV